MFAVLAIAEYIFMQWVALPGGIQEVVRTSNINNFIFQIKGLETTSNSENHKIRLKIGSLMVAPRKYFLFSIQPLNEAVFEDFSLEYFRKPQEQSLFCLSDIQETILPVDRKVMFSGPFDIKTGLITRGVIRRFSLSIYNGDEVETMVRSEKAEMDFKNNKIRLVNVTIEQNKFKRVILSTDAVLKNSDRTIYIYEKYTILNSDGITDGSGVKIKL